MRGVAGDFSTSLQIHWPDQRSLGEGTEAVRTNSDILGLLSNVDPAPQSVSHMVVARYDLLLLLAVFKASDARRRLHCWPCIEDRTGAVCHDQHCAGQQEYVLEHESARARQIGKAVLGIAERGNPRFWGGDKE